MSDLKNLFEPITIGRLEVKNRLVMPPMGVNFGVDEEGNVTEQLWEYLAARARGGAGMIVVGGGAVNPEGLDLPRLPHLWDDKFTPALARMTGAVHEYQTAFGMQLLHGGRQAYHDDKVAPSPLPSLGVVSGVPRELTVAEIGEIVEDFGDAARRCREAGFDFVEVHGAHGYLVTQFLAPNSNRRQDEYGGPFDNRIRFLREVLENIRQKTGPDFIVGVRINGHDYIEGGWTIDDTRRIGPILEKNGADYLHVSAGVYGSFPVTIPSMYAPPGCFVHLAEEVKKVVSIPVIAAGRIKDPELADLIIGDGRADMVSMGRAHLADPELADKAKSGRTADIRPCIGCCLGCAENVLMNEAATCVMNPEVGREHLLGGLKPAPTLKKIMVVGAGPAGLALARLAALRGHGVVICEEGGSVGGMLRIASLPPGRGELMELVEYYERELEDSGVEIRLNTKLDTGLIDAIDPDCAVVATGALPQMPQIEGLFDTEMVLSTVVDVLGGGATPGRRVLVLGGNQAGLSVADFLAEGGREVVVLHWGAHFAEEMAGNDRTYLRERMKRPEVELHKNVVIKRFLPRGVVAVLDGMEVGFEGFDDLVISEGMRSIRMAVDFFNDRGIEVHVIGDAKSPRSLLYSQSEADELGRSI